MNVLLSCYTLLVCSSLPRLVSHVEPFSLLPAQQTHYRNTTKYLAAAKVTERSTWDVTKGRTLISLDRYDGCGHKTEAVEMYAGDRYLERFIGSNWMKVHDTTRFTFTYDANGWQTSQENHDFDPEERNQMYQYDEWGNIERWVTGHSFGVPHKAYLQYDEHGQVLQEKYCWEDTCLGIGEEPYDEFLLLKHHLTYNPRGLLVTDLVKYIDGVAGEKYEYTYNEAGRVIRRKEISLHSFGDTQHDIPTLADINSMRLSHEWEYQYDAAGNLVKETWTEHWTEVPTVHVFTYNRLGLISESLTDGYDLTVYTYDENGLLQHSEHYMVDDGDRKLREKYEYTYH